jgi:hypothetical protein
MLYIDGYSSVRVRRRREGDSERERIYEQIKV